MDEDRLSCPSLVEHPFRLAAQHLVEAPPDEAEPANARDETEHWWPEEAADREHNEVDRKPHCLLLD